jgi:hypothetical protein
LSKLLGEDDPDTLTALGNLACSYADYGDHATARKIFATVYRGCRHRLGGQDYYTLTTLGNYAISIGKCGNQALALRLKRIVYQRCRSVAGAEHPLTLDALNNLAASLRALGSEAIAHQMFTETRQICSRILGSGHPQTLAVWENAAITAPVRQRTEAFRDIYEARLAVQGPAHPACLRSLKHLMIATRDSSPGALATRMSLVRADPSQPGFDLGEVRLDDDAMDDYVETLELALASHERQVAEYGPDALASLLSLCHVAHALAAVNQFDRQIEDALEQIECAAQGLESQFGVRSESRRSAQVLLAWIRSSAGQTERR